MNTFVLVGMAGLVLLTAISLFRLIEYKKLSGILETITSWKYSFLFIALGFLFFFIYFNSTMQGLQAVETITDGSVTFTIQNNSYIEYFSYMPYMTGALVLNFVFNAATMFMSFGIFGRKRMNKLKLGL